MDSQPKSLTVAAACAVLKRLSDEDMETVLLEWVKSQSVARQDRFFGLAKTVVCNGVHPFNCRFHYLLVQSPALVQFLYYFHRFNELIWECDDRLGDRAELAFARWTVGGQGLVQRLLTALEAGDLVGTPYREDLVKALEAKSERLTDGFCFKLADNGIFATGLMENGRLVRNAQHVPMHVSNIARIFTSLVQAHPANKDIGHPFKQEMSSVEFEIDMEGGPKRVLCCSFE